MPTGERIRELRKAKGLKQAELAELLGNDGNTISRWEHNKIGIGSAYITRLAQVLNTTTDYLLCKTDDPSLPENVLSISSSTNDVGVPKRLIIKNRDMYVDLPETTEGFEMLRKFFEMQSIKNNVPQTAVVAM